MYVLIRGQDQSPNVSVCARAYTATVPTALLIDGINSLANNSMLWIHRSLSSQSYAIITKTPNSPVSSIISNTRPVA